MAGVGVTALQAEDEGSASGLLPAMGLAFAGVAALALVSLAAEGPEGQYVVIGRPGADQAETLAMISAADGALLAAGGFANILIAASNRPEFAAELRQAGAWAVFPAPGFLGCTTPSDMTGRAE